MTNYLIYRHGSNAANQSLCGKLAVDIVEAKRKSDAIRIAKENNTCYGNQFFDAVCESKANRIDWNAVCEDQSVEAEVT